MMLGLSLLVVAVATLTTASAATQQVDIPEHGGPIVLSKLKSMVSMQLFVCKWPSLGLAVCSSSL